MRVRITQADPDTLLDWSERILGAQSLDIERFRGLTAKEIWAMLNLVTPIQETRAYQSIFAEGKVEGKVEGKAEGKVSVLKPQLTRRLGALPTWAERRIDAAPVAQLDAWLDGRGQDPLFFLQERR